MLQVRIELVHGIFEYDDCETSSYRVKMVEVMIIRTKIIL